ncbi:ABC transporter permease [Mangrovicoccus algicola]|uniref:ABC transporter permease subunit n=1 Tax=Mangrovicoccus algicola TaxID=2771008 RepID=A0A8J7CJ98_9RHOB|nr:ABC transporter permease subunit [Mangrovicoccus algicola]MBE3640545.1 ABC transporter permease subunit [Mangrovicoccus algicola]
MQPVIDYLPLLLQGLAVTLKLAVSTAVLGLVLGLGLALAKISGRGWLARPAFWATDFLRGIPEFLVLLVIYFGGTQVLAQVFGPGAPEVSPFLAGLLALGLIFGAYASETFRAAFLSVPKGQVEAGRAYGFSRWQCFRHIQLPQIWRIAIPGLGNLWQGAVKDTALVSIIGLEDVMRKSQQAAQSTREPFTFYLVAALMFLVITLISMAVIARAEKRAGRGMAEAG